MQGQCLCGAVTITVPDDHSQVGVCHCGACRRWGGGPLFAISLDSGVEIGGREHITEYRSSAWARRGFCRHCGTHLYYRGEKGPSCAVPAGLFSDAQGLVLSAQIFIDRKPDYYALANETPTLTEQEVLARYGDPS
ncbi:GFA family protein [Verticiella sediminum]|uniref:GFA family protein n=1 Tax=Verticiella sediminum TaxID=1247510 RepID=A0A556ABW9_9BURK|nr:GFA family protein [Verticiella sediminum]TSH90370.1 GFA family protein [Verticiella sediminum]